MIRHFEKHHRDASKYPEGASFFRTRRDERGLNGDGLYLHVGEASGPCIALVERKLKARPWRVDLGPFRERGQKDERYFKNFKSAVKLFRKLGRKALNKATLT